MTRLQFALDSACDRMDSIQIAMFRDSVAVAGTVVAEGRFYANGPVCYVATLNGKQTASIVKTVWDSVVD